MNLETLIEEQTKKLDKEFPDIGGRVEDETGRIVGWVDCSEELKAFLRKSIETAYKVGKMNPFGAAAYPDVKEYYQSPEPKKEVRC